MEIETGRITYKEVNHGTSSKGAYTRTVYTLNNKKYSTFNESLSTFEKGDLVNISFEKSVDGKYNNISKIDKVEQKVESEFVSGDKVTEKEQTIWERKDLRMARENALSNTTSLLNTIAIVTPEYLANAWKDEDPFIYVVKKAQEIVDFIYS
jgi:hypothetical protein